MGDGSFNKPESSAAFLLSPNYLLERVREECQEVLMRGYIYENRPIDLAFVKELHKNTADFLKENKLSGEEFKQALVVAGNKAEANINLPAKPMLFYQAFINDKDSVEVLSPYLYIPVAMINEVRAQRGGLIKTNVLLILPEDLTPKELVSLVEDRPILKDTLIQFFDNNPNATKYLTEKALEQKIINQGSVHKLTVPEQPRTVVAAAGTNNAALSQGSVTIGGTVQAHKLGVVARGKVTVTGNIEAGNALLASLYDDVHIKSLIERHGRDSENFDEVLVRAKVHAENLLQIFAGKNVVFEGAETDSGVKTEVMALASILDLPVALIHQRVQRFYGETKVTTKDIYLEQSSSSHKSGGDICMAAREKAVLYAPKFTAKKLQVVGGQSAAILDTTEQRIHEEQVISEKDTWYGGSSTKSTSMASSATSSKGAELNVKQLEVTAGADGIQLRNTTSTAERNLFYTPDGEVEFLAGRNDFSSSSSLSSSNPFWTESEPTTVKKTSWSGCNITGQVEIHAKNVTLEMVSATTSDLLQKIEQGLDGRGTITCILKGESLSIESDYNEAPGPALIGLVALATAIVTHGASLTWAGSLGFTGSMCTAVGAGFGSLCSQAAAQIVANNGDPLKAIKALASKDTVKSLAVSMISAGALHKACELLKIPVLEERQIFEHMKYNLARASVSATLNMSINKRDPEQALLDGLVDAAIGTALAPMTSQIDDWHNLGEISSINHKIVHGILGAIRGALGHDGAIAGALEGVTSAILHDIVDKKQPAKKVKATDQPKTLEKQSATAKPQNVDQQEQAEKGQEKVSNVNDKNKATSPNPNKKDQHIAQQHLQSKEHQPSTEKLSSSVPEKANYLDATKELGKSLISAFNDWRNKTGRFIGTEVFTIVHEGGIGATETAQVLQQLHSKAVDFTTEEMVRASEGGFKNTATAKGIKTAHSKAVNYVVDEAVTITHGGGFKETSTAKATTAVYDKGVDWWENTDRIDKSRQIGALIGKHGPSMLLTFGSSTFLKTGSKILGEATDIAVETGKKVATSSSGKILSQFEKFKQSQPKRITISASSPGEIAHGYGELSARQAKHLAELPAPGKTINLFKSDINVTDLAALTAKTGDEFYMFTLGSKRIIVRGFSDKFRIEGELFNKLTTQGWRLSAHTHPGTANKVLLSSGADRATLKVLGQEQSVIVNSSGSRRIFTKNGIETDLSSTFFNLATPKP